MTEILAAVGLGILRGLLTPKPAHLSLNTRLPVPSAEDTALLEAVLWGARPEPKAPLWSPDPF